MVSLTIISLLLIITTHQVCALNILGIFPLPILSHFLQFKLYLQELAKRGHNVTVVSHFPNKNPIPNYHDIRLGNETKMISNPLSTRSRYYRHIPIGLTLTQVGIESCKTLVRNQQVRDFVKHKQKFDVVVYEQSISDCALGIAYKLDAPVVAFTASTLIHYHCKRFGIPCNPAYGRSFFLGGGTKPTIYQRLERNIVEFYYTIFFTIEQWVDEYTLAEYYNNIPPLEQLARDIKILLLNQNFVVTGSRLLPFNVIEVAGHHVPEAKPLTGELKKFVDEAEHGVIYINFGTIVRFWETDNETQDAIFEALKEFPQRVVLRYDGQASYIDKTKMYSSKWLPQVDILAHPNTLLFISHGGFGGILEALYHDVPMINVPFFGDHYSNAAAIEERGFGVEMDDLNKQSITSAIKKVLDPMFRTRALQVSKLFRDRPMSPLNTAVYWTEFVARNANFTFRTPAADTPLYQHLYLDVAAVLILIFFTVVYLTKKVISLLIFVLRRNAKSLFTRVRDGEQKSKAE